MKSTKHRRSEYGVSVDNPRLSINRRSLHTSVADRIKYKYQTSQDNECNFHPDLLTLITRHMWNIYRVSHLYNIIFTKVKLKQYAAFIKKELVNNVTDAINGISYDVKVNKISVLENEESNCFGLQIEVFIIKDEKTALQYKGVLLSAGESISLNNVTHLPFLMCIGAVSVTQIVHKAVSKLFDTIIRPLKMSEDDLMWMSAMINDSENTTKFVLYNYKYVNSSSKNEIRLTIPYHIIKKLWNKIHPSNEEEVTFDQIYMFHKQIQCQLIVTYSINFENLTLNTVNNGNAIISCDGKVKLLTEEAVSKILSFLNEVSILLDTDCPAMSNQF